MDAQHISFAVRLEEPAATDAGAALTRALNADGATVERTSETSYVVACDLPDASEAAALRNRVLSGDYDRRASAALGVAASADRTAFAEAYEAARCGSGETLTPHQREALEACAAGVDVHLKAPAGSGKTLWALHRLVNELRGDAGLAVFVARNRALACFAAKWVLARGLLARLRVLVEPFAAGVLAPRARGGRLVLEAPDDGARVAYRLVVVDEAHHVYGDDALRAAVEALVAPTTRRLLLSDVSQCRSRHVFYPAIAAEARLTEVVRCSKRIVAGAMAFQLGGEQKLLTTCAHDDAGPPLKSFLFDASGDRFADYAARVRDALGHVENQFPGLGLDDRVALVVPDEPFRAALERALAGDDAFELVDAATAACRLERTSERPWLVLDTVDHMDGLERLVVICVGLDAKIDDGSAVVARRSLLYRAMTRAHLVVVVVNEFVAGGWLEFLGSVRLREEERFDAATELARSRTAAAEGAVRADVSRAVVAALGGPAADAVLNELCEVVTRRLERSGRGAADEAAAAVLEWRDETRAAAAAVAAAAGADAYGGRGDAPIDALGAAVALALRKREAARVDVAARRAYASWRDGRRAARARAYFADLAPPAVAAFAAKKLVEGYDDADFDRGADAVREVWTAVDAELRARVRNADRPDGDAVYAAAVAAFCAGSPVEAAVEAAARNADRAVADGVVEAAVEAAIAAETGGGSFLGWGGETFAPLKLAGPAATEIRKSVARRHGMLDNPAPAGVARTRAPPGDDVAKAAAKPAWVASVEASAREFRKMWAAAEDATETALAAAADEFDLDLGAHGDLFEEATVMSFLHFFSGGTGPDDEAEQAPCFARRLVEERCARENDASAQAARVAAAVRAAAEAAAVALGAGALARLEARVRRRWRAGEDLERAAAAAVEAYAASDGRGLVNQTIWDPSSNGTRRAGGARAGQLLKFMPFAAANDCDGLETDAFMSVFAFLRFESIGALCRVSKKWRSAARDPFWKPDVVVYAWGSEDTSGLGAPAKAPTLLDFSLSRTITSVACADAATLAVTLDGAVFHWGRSWEPDLSGDGASGGAPTPTRLPELRDVVAVACTPSGYYHGRGRALGYSCAALGRGGDLFTWGNNVCGQLLQPVAPRGSRDPNDYFAKRPTRVAYEPHLDVARTLKVALGLEYVAVQYEARGGARRVAWAGRFSDNARPRALEAARELDGAELRSLAGGAFHCCALTTAGQLWTFGDEYGPDESNGNLLGLGPRGGAGGAADPDPLVRQRGDGEHVPRPPRPVPGLPPVAAVAASTYATLAIAVDGRCFSWGDCDGHALGHATLRPRCDTPARLTSLRGAAAAAGALSYTNGAVASKDGRVYCWGGNAWEGGIANAGREGPGDVVAEVAWRGVPPDYACAQVALGHNHGLLLFELRV